MKRIAIYSHSIAPSIDGVCRRFTGILHEMERQGLATLLFTMEDAPQDLPNSTEFVTLDHIIFPTYPNKKVAWPTIKSFMAIVLKLRTWRPDVSRRKCVLQCKIRNNNEIILFVLSISGHPCSCRRFFSDVCAGRITTRHSRCWLLPH